MWFDKHGHVYTFMQHASHTVALEFRIDLAANMQVVAERPNMYCFQQGGSCRLMLQAKGQPQSQGMEMPPANPRQKGNQNLPRLHTSPRRRNSTLT